MKFYVHVRGISVVAYQKVGLHWRSELWLRTEGAVVVEARDYAEAITLGRQVAEVTKLLEAAS